MWLYVTGNGQQWYVQVASPSKINIVTHDEHEYLHILVKPTYHYFAWSGGPNYYC